MRYINVSGQDLILMTGQAAGVKVLDGETVDIDDPGLIAGMVGQESVWQPVTDNEQEE